MNSFITENLSPGKRYSFEYFKIEIFREQVPFNRILFLILKTKAKRSFFFFTGERERKKLKMVARQLVLNALIISRIFEHFLCVPDQLFYLLQIFTIFEKKSKEKIILFYFSFVSEKNKKKMMTESLSEANFKFAS